VGPAPSGLTLLLQLQQLLLVRPELPLQQQQQPQDPTQPASGQLQLLLLPARHHTAPAPAPAAGLLQPLLLLPLPPGHAVDLRVPLLLQQLLHSAIGWAPSPEGLLLLQHLA
jgi:hypothetical protein